MNLNVSSWSIRNPVAVSLLFILLTLAGIWGFMSMKVQDFPDIDFPVITVAATLPGASPPQLESDVARRIEDAMANLQGLKHIKSSLTDGIALITAEFDVEVDSQTAMEDVRNAVASVRATLPADLQDPVITKAELASTPVLTFAITSTSMDDEALSWFVDSVVSKRLLGVAGIGAVNRVGGLEREIRVALDPGRLIALNATAGEISRQIRAVQQEAAGGRTALNGGEQSIRTLATLASADDIAALDVPLDDGRRLRLDQIATVTDTVAEPRSSARMDARSAVAFDILRSRGASELEVAAAARTIVQALRDTHPDLRIDEAVSAVEPIANNFDGSMLLLYEGAALAVLVVFFFLRDWRATLIAAVALPLSAIPTFAVMHLMGFSLNIVSLLSLSLVVGVLVDDAIVEVENIERHLRMGKTPFRAADEAANEIGLAVVATTFTLIAVFLPTSLMSGVVGKYFLQFGWTAAVAVFFSLVVARMLTPTMAAYMMRAPTGRAHRPRWITRYLQLAGTSLRHRGATLGLAALLVVAGLGVATQLPGEFIPPDDGDHTQVSLQLPPGSALATTQAMAEQARLLLMQNPHVRSIYTAVGGSAQGSDPHEGPGAAASVTRATLTANLVPRSERGGVRRQAVERELRTALAALPGVRIGVGDGASEGYELVLASEDGQRLQQHARRVEQELRSIPGIGAVTSSASLTRPELVVRPDAARAAALGVTSEEIAEALRIATVGDYDQDLAKLNLSERQVPIVVRLADTGRDDLETLRRLPVAGVHGSVPLGSVATLAIESGPSELTRYDRMRNVNLSVELNGRPLGDVERAAAALPSLQALPDGIVAAPAGNAETMGELVVGFSLAMAAGVLCVYMVLVLLLKDFAQPMTVLVALVLSIPGAFFALWVTGASLSMPSMIGLIMLMGITTKNSILLVDYIVLARRDHGYGRWRAVLDACRKRARPIVMTTIAMGAGMLPIALGLGADSSFRAPMAIVVIGGLITSTVLCLFVIPVVYSLVDDALLWLKARLRSRTSGYGATPASAID